MESENRYRALENLDLENKIKFLAFVGKIAITYTFPYPIELLEEFENTLESEKLKSIFWKFLIEHYTNRIK